MPENTDVVELGESSRGVREGDQTEKGKAGGLGEERCGVCGGGVGSKGERKNGVDITEERDAKDEVSCGTNSVRGLDKAQASGRWCGRGR